MCPREHKQPLLGTVLLLEVAMAYSRIDESANRIRIPLRIPKGIEESLDEAETAYSKCYI
jgi:hypothetical protein